MEETSINPKYEFEEPPEEEEENYILGCMIKSKSVYKCRYCPTIVCLNEGTMQAHVSSKVKLVSFIIQSIELGLSVSESRRSR